MAGQSRSIVEGRAAGRLHVYAHPVSLELLGAEMAAPDAEHLSHHLALMVQNRMRVSQALQSPFYHPTVEEALRTALRDAQAKRPLQRPRAELSVCESAPEPPLR